MSATEAEKLRSRRRYLDPAYREWKREYNRKRWAERMTTKPVEKERPQAAIMDCEGRLRIGE